MSGSSNESVAVENLPMVRLDEQEIVMETKGWSRECPVAGCATNLGGGRHRERHVALQHYTCSCGWVGVYWSKHMAMMRRKGDEREHELLGPVEMPT